MPQPRPKARALPERRESNLNMKKATQASEDLQKIADLAADIDVAMVTTLDVSSQTLTSRPMMPLRPRSLVNRSQWVITST